MGPRSVGESVVGVGLPQEVRGRWAGRMGQQTTRYHRVLRLAAFGLCIGVFVGVVGPGSPSGLADPAVLSPAVAAELAAASDRLANIETKLDSLVDRQRIAAGDRSTVVAERDAVTVTLTELDGTSTALGDRAGSLVLTAGESDRYAARQRAVAVSEWLRAGQLRQVVEGFAAQLYVGRASDPSVLAAVLDQFDPVHPTTPRKTRAKIYGRDAAQTIAQEAAAHQTAGDTANRSAKDAAAAATQARADADTARAALDETGRQRLDLETRQAALDTRLSELDTELATIGVGIAALETERSELIEQIHQLRETPNQPAAPPPQPKPSTTGSDTAAAVSPAGIDPVLYRALTAAQAAAGLQRPACGVDWAVLAAITETESDLARYGGAAISPDGAVAPAILGIRLDGTTPGTATIVDTDRGTLDGDTQFDRAVGPFQFIPSSWDLFARDANRDGTADPHNVHDAAAAAAEHLCRAGWEFADPGQAARAIYGYNPSWSYVATILDRADTWRATIAPPPPATTTTTTAPPPAADNPTTTTTTAGPATGEPQAPPGPVGPFSLPVERAVIDADPTALAVPHHDYPAWDLPLPQGTPLYALTSGTVTGTTDDGRCGVGLVVATADRWTWTYCHATTLNVTTGTQVTAGQQVATSGNTGNTYGPHLHLQIKDPAGVLVCPQPLLAAIHQNQAPPPTSTSCIAIDTAEQRLASDAPPTSRPDPGAAAQPSNTTTRPATAATPTPPTGPTGPVGPTTTASSAGAAPPSAPARPAAPRAGRPVERLEPPIGIAAHPPRGSTAPANLAAGPPPPANTATKTPAPAMARKPTTTTMAASPAPGPTERGPVKKPSGPHQPAVGP